jgi:hypothetical protein
MLTRLALSGGIVSFAGALAPRVLLWETFVTLAILGFGLGTLRLLCLKGRGVPLAGAAGIAVWLLVGGWLNLAHVASKPVLLTGLSAGIVLAIVELTRPSYRQRLAASWRTLRADRVTLRVAVVIGAYFLLIFALRLRPALWNTFDDPRGYMAFTAKASALSGLQPEPFSERQIVNGLGGGIFLGATMLAGADLSAMGYLEKAFGYLLYAAMLWSVLRSLGLSRIHATALLYLLPLLPLLDVNLTSAYLAAALVLAILLLLVRAAREPHLPANLALLIGLLLGAVCTLKTTGLLFGGLVTAFCALQFFWHRRSLQSLPLWLVAGLASLFVMLPWMLLLRRNEGTLLFPVFGSGDHISAYGLFPAPSHLLAKTRALFMGWPDTLFFLAGGAVVWNLSRRTSLTALTSIVAFFAAALMATLSISLSTSGEGIDRYTMFFSVPALIMLVGCLLLAWKTAGARSLLRLAVAGPLTVCLFCALIVHANGLFFDDWLRLAAVRGDFSHLRIFDTVLTPETLQRRSQQLQRAQQTVPRGAAILATVRDAYGFDWHRNIVYIADYPGMASPPPGMPMLGPSDDLRRYLLLMGIQYIAYDPTLVNASDGFTDFTAHPLSYVSVLRILEHPRSRLYYTPWSRMESAIAQHTLAQMQELAKRQPVVYDTPTLRIVSLQTH